MNVILTAAAKPLAIVLLAGAVKFLYDYQASMKVVPSLIDGALTAALTASSFLGVNGAISGVQNARIAAAAKE